jgi:hypothetical protein
VSYHERRLADLGLDDVRRPVDFLQGDACNLKPVHRLRPHPRRQPDRPPVRPGGASSPSVHERLNVGGLLMIASPYTWLEEHTKREDWIGGFKKDGESYTTLDGLKALLGRISELVRAARRALRDPRNASQAPAHAGRSDAVGTHPLNGARRVSFDFDHPINRDGTASVKHDGRAAVFGTDAVTPLWVADMDFAAPPAVVEALARARCTRSMATRSTRTAPSTH